MVVFQEQVQSDLLFTCKVTNVFYHLAYKNDHNLMTGSFYQQSLRPYINTEYM